MRIALSLTFLLISILIPLFYVKVLEFFVIYFKSGWTFGSIYVRLLVIIMFTIALYLFLSQFERTRKINFFVVFLISILPGFGISFIKPIYDIDYGMYDDPFVIENNDQLTMASSGEFQPTEERIIVAFFTTTCPHCMDASTKLGINKAAGMALEVHAFFPGTREDTDKFLKEHRGQSFHSYLIPTDEEFTSLGGYVFPSVFVIDKNGKTEKHWTGDMINYTVLDYLYDLEP